MLLIEERFEQEGCFERFWIVVIANDQNTHVTFLELPLLWLIESTHYSRTKRTCGKRFKLEYHQEHQPDHAGNAHLARHRIGAHMGDGVRARQYGFGLSVQHRLQHAGHDL